VIFSVVDPRVGSDTDRPVVIRASGKWYVGPDNGVFDMVCNRSNSVQAWEILWRPDTLSNTFHGRDLYAPVCGMLAKGETLPREEIQWEDRHHWPNDLLEVIYIDHFGNILTGIQAGNLSPESVLELVGHEFRHARTFSDVKPGQGLWYENSSGLIEIAVNQRSAKEILKIKISDPVIIKV
jgi:S-adenosylmethionine hydrolase